MVWKNTLMLYEIELSPYYAKQLRYIAVYVNKKDEEIIKECIIIYIDEFIKRDKEIIKEFYFTNE